MENKADWKYCVVGNIKKTHYDDNGLLRYGTAAFTGGTKVYLCGRLWDKKGTHIDALGLNRRKYLQVVRTDISHIENVRVSRTFKPTVIGIMNDFEFYDCWWGNTFQDKKEVEDFVKWWNQKDNSPDEEIVVKKNKFGMTLKRMGHFFSSLFRL